MRLGRVKKGAQSHKPVNGGAGNHLEPTSLTPMLCFHQTYKDIQILQIISHLLFILFYVIYILRVWYLKYHEAVSKIPFNEKVLVMTYFKYLITFYKKSKC